MRRLDLRRWRGGVVRLWSSRGFDDVFLFQLGGCFFGMLYFVCIWYFVVAVGHSFTYFSLHLTTLHVPPYCTIYAQMINLLCVVQS